MPAWSRGARAARAFLLGAVVLTLGCEISEEEEAALGAENAEQIDAQLPLIDDPAIAGYLARLGSAVARTADESDREWRFAVVDNRSINAFAVPGGYIYVNRGLIERAERLDELAGVLGHEIAHVVLRHSVEQMEKAQKTNVGLTVVCTFTNLCESDVARVAINVGGTAWFARHSRQDELEADSAGIEYVSSAGIDPRGVPSFFRRLLEERARRPAAVETWFGTHPLEEARIEQAQRIIESLAIPAGESLLRDDPEFQAFRTRLAALPPPPEPPPGAP
jgi:predicted Zn-dependent protease